MTRNGFEVQQNGLLASHGGDFLVFFVNEGYLFKQCIFCSVFSCVHFLLLKEPLNILY